MSDEEHIEQAVEQTPAVGAKQVPVEAVTLRHPHTGKTEQAAVGSEELLSLMGRGYAQVKGD